MQSSNINHFLLSLDHSLQKYPAEQRERIRQRVIDDLAHTDIFRPLYLEDDDEYEPNEVSIKEMTREERVVAKQLEYGTEPDEPPKNRWGRNDLHEAVAISDVEAVQRLLADDPESINHKDNNFNTPIDQALLDENKSVINLFKNLGLM